MPCAGNYIDDCAANKLTSNQNLHKFTSTHIYATNIMFIDISLHDTAEPFTVVNNIERQPWCVRACARVCDCANTLPSLLLCRSPCFVVCVCLHVYANVFARARARLCVNLIVVVNAHTSLFKTLRPPSAVKFHSTRKKGMLAWESHVARTLARCRA